MNRWLRTLLHVGVVGLLIYGLGALLINRVGLTDSVGDACNAAFAVYTAITVVEAFKRYRRQGSGPGSDAPAG